MMDRIYYDPSEPGSYGGLARLLRAVRKKNNKKKIPKREVIDWLQTQDTYTLHKPARKRFVRNPYIVFGPYELWQADLNDMRGLSEFNDGFNYILTVIDVFSKYLYARVLKRKEGAEVASAFQSIFKEATKTPKCLQTDKGTEFTGVKTKQIFKKYGIRYVTTQNPDVKAAVVERVNRTLKSRMWRYLTYKNTYRYINVLEQLVKSYNRSEHSSLGSGLRPFDVNDANDKDSVHRAWLHMYRKMVSRKRPKLKVGDTVRIAKEKGTFSKGYETSWSKEVFVVRRVNRLMPLPMYTLTDLNGKEEVKGQFYEHEVQKVSIQQSDRLYKIDKILDTKGRGRSTRYLVKWQGYGAEFNSWVRAQDLENV